ncbi:SDR family oxidoreductase [Marimonas lutisalis]|uniref:SDR family oxidoreductase n=1 Tax=Marimonas lutisalis TaxID=2545756 RepID=UPI0010F736AB|nr:SDR family oxidoreductase [Marimonas lutisalis]
MSTVLVIGAYGLIGSGVVRELRACGHRVIGLGRDKVQAKAAFPDIDWFISDLAHLTEPRAWSDVLEDADFVVNCAGALQDGGGDRLATVHHDAIAALASICAESGIGLVQISAAGAEPDAPTAFMRTKAEGDASIRAFGGDYWILRPGLVLADSAYGGTALLRLLCAVPVVQPLAMGRKPVQCVGLPDLARAVVSCIEGDIPPGTEADLVEDEPHRLSEVVREMRKWLGFRKARLTLPAPRFALYPVSWIADALGRLGWRSPLRSTAVKSLAQGITGDAEPWRQAGGTPMKSLRGIFTELPARPENRLAARMQLLMPLVILTLAVFWIASGAIGLIRLDAARAVLAPTGWDEPLRSAAVVGGAVLDIFLGLMVLVRRTARLACWGMGLVSLGYLAAASTFLPGLWLDPLGPLVKVVPGIVLALVALPLLSKR